MTLIYPGKTQCGRFLIPMNQSIMDGSFFPCHLSLTQPTATSDGHRGRSLPGKAASTYKERSRFTSTWHAVEVLSIADCSRRLEKPSEEPLANLLLQGPSRPSTTTVSMYLGLWHMQ